MGRTITSATQTWVEEEKALGRFKRALRKGDQRLLEELLALSRVHVAEASYAANLYPLDIYLISMLIEMYRKLKRMEAVVAEVSRTAGLPEPAAEIEGLPDLLELVRRSTPESAAELTAGEDPEEVFIEPLQYVDLDEVG